MYNNMYNGGYGFWIFDVLFAIVFWVLIIWLIVVLIRWLSHPHGDENHIRHKDNTALKIIEERYARGEINKDEFEQKKKDLTSNQ
jgi:putative membrane protein